MCLGVIARVVNPNPTEVTGGKQEFTEAPSERATVVHGSVVTVLKERSIVVTFTVNPIEFGKIPRSPPTIPLIGRWRAERWKSSGAIRPDSAVSECGTAV